MKYLFLTILLLSCSKSILTVTDAPVVVTEDKPTFQLAMPFEGGSAVEPVKSMSVWVPVVCTTFNSYVPSKKEVASCVKTILGVDTVVCIDTVFPCTLWCASPPKIVHSRFLAYLMLVVGFIVGVVTMLILHFMTVNKYPELPKR